MHIYAFLRKSISLENFLFKIPSIVLECAALCLDYTFCTRLQYSRQMNPCYQPMDQRDHAPTDGSTVAVVIAPNIPPEIPA